MSKHPILPDTEASLWRQSYQDSAYPTLEEDLQTDAVIVGAGITGLTTAYLLKQSGMKVVVLDKRTVGSGTTGRTTGKVSSQHNIIYTELLKSRGRETAQLYGEANEAAITRIEQIINKEKIDCAWRRADHSVYTNDPDQLATIKEEAEIAASLGLPAAFEANPALPFDTLGAVSFSNQATFHSQNYMLGLAKAVDGGGSHVFENSGVIGIRDGSPGRVRTRRAKVIAKHIVVATNVPTLPLAARGAYCLLEYPTESYIVAGKYEGSLSDMYISPDEHHYSILPAEIGGEKLLLIGGEGHISGMRTSRQKHYAKLAAYAEKHFGITEIKYKWSDRDYLAYDSMPLVGKLYPWSANLYVGTAFMKWGLTNGTVAGMILSDLICGNSNPWAPAFNSIRSQPIKSIPRVAKKYVIG